MNIVKKIYPLIFCLSLSACSSGFETKLSNGSVDYSNRNSYGYGLYVEILNNHVLENINKADILNKTYILEYYDKDGILTSSESYDFANLNEKIQEACQHVKIDVNDLSLSKIGIDDSDRGDLKKNMVSGEIVVSVLPFKETQIEYVTLTNQKKIKAIESCAQNYLDTESLDVNSIARFVADKRFKQYSTPDLDAEIKKSLSDKKLTWSKIINLYVKLGKNIESSISNDLTKL